MQLLIKTGIHNLKNKIHYRKMTLYSSLSKKNSQKNIYFVYTKDVYLYTFVATECK